MHRSPRSPYSVSLYLHLTNCTLSHNTLSAFNYCLEVSGLRVTHSTGSLCGCVFVLHVCVRECLHSMCKMSFVWRPEYRGKCWIPKQLFFLPPLLITYRSPFHPATTLPPPQGPVFRRANGWCWECVRAVIARVSNLSREQNSEVISDTI